MSINIDPSAIQVRELPTASVADAPRHAARLDTDMRIGGEAAVGPAGASEVREAGGFGAILEKTVLAANAKAREASAKAEDLAQGRIDDLHGTMITMKEADISLKLVGAVRDKVLDAFHELWRINV